MIRLCVGGLMMLALGCAASVSKPLPPARPGVEYLRRLHQRIEFTRGQMPAIIASAQTAARNVSRGARIYAAGSQWDFVHEMVVRAGGLQGIDFVPTSSDQLRTGDVVLYAARSALAARELVQISGYREAGAYVIAFASTRQSDLRYFRPDVLIDSGPEPGLLLDDGKIAPLDSVVNVINAWTWTGEFIAACTRLGKMPVIYQSYHLPTGRDRAAKYTGSMFHADVKIAPIKSGLLGLAYLEQVEQSLDAIALESSAALETASNWLRDAGPRNSDLQAMGHMFPEHCQDIRAPQMFGTMSRFEGTPTVRPAAFVTVLGYHAPPQLSIDAAHMRRSELLYTSVARADDDRADYILYIDPHWPITDACVAVPGYDVLALPQSGVMQAAIYWSLVARASSMVAGE